MVPGDIQLAVDDPGPRVRVHEVLLLGLVGPHVVAEEEYLQRVSSLAVQRGRFVLDDEGIHWFGEENRQMTACLGDELGVRGYRARGHVVLLQKVGVVVFFAFCNKETRDLHNPGSYSSPWFLNSIIAASVPRRLNLQVPAGDSVTHRVNGG